MKSWIKLLKAYDGKPEGELVEVEKAVADALVAGGIAELSQVAEKALADTVKAEVATMVRSITESIDQGIKDALAATPPARPNITLVEAEADKTKSLGDQVKCIIRAQMHGDTDAAERLAKVYKSFFVPDGKDESEKIDVRRALQENIGSSGGFRLSSEYSNELLKVPAEDAVMIPGIRVSPMSTKTKEMPVLDQYITPTTGNSAYYGGVEVYRRGENRARPETQQGYEPFKLEATDLVALTKVSRDAIADAPEIESDFRSLIGDAINWRREYEFILGTGVGQPLGYRNSAATITVNREVAGTILYEDITAMMSKLMAVCLNRAVFIANVTCLPQIMALKDEAGNNIFLSAGGARDWPGMSLLSKPLLFSEKVPVLGTAGDLTLIDRGMYVEGQRQGVELAVSNERYFDTDEIGLRVKLRNDGKPLLRAPIKQSDGSNTEVSFAAILGDVA